MVYVADDEAHMDSFDDVDVKMRLCYDEMKRGMM